MKMIPSTHSTMPIVIESPTIVVTVCLAPFLSPAPSWRPASTAAPAAKMFSIDTIIRRSGRVTPTAASAASLPSIPMYAVSTML